MRDVPIPLSVRLPLAYIVGRDLFVGRITISHPVILNMVMRALYFPAALRGLFNVIRFRRFYLVLSRHLDSPEVSVGISI